VKDILVHLDGGERDSVRLDMAIGLAKRHGAVLTGLFARIDSFKPSAVARHASDVLVKVRNGAKAVFDAAVKEAGIASRWWQLSHGEPGHVLSETMFCARYADLVVMGQFESKTKQVPEDLVEHVVLHCGRPVLVVPHSGSFPTLGEHMVVAWNADREAVRALNDAKPLMVATGGVTVLSLHATTDEGGTSMGDVPHVDVVDHLSRWGIDARLERMPVDGLDKMDVLLSRLCDLGADLLVMGAHSHSALVPWHAGGAAYILRHMTIPTLLSN